MSFDGAPGQAPAYVGRGFPRHPQRYISVMQRLWLIILLTFIIGGHIAMWTSDMPRDLALRLTLINAAGWAVILIPAWLVTKWAAAHQQRDTKAPANR